MRWRLMSSAWPISSACTSGSYAVHDPAGRASKGLHPGRRAAALGLELAEAGRRDDGLNARRDLQALDRIGVIGSQRAQRPERLLELRRLLVHE
jgi:hypothetical protein